MSWDQGKKQDHRHGFWESRFQGPAEKIKDRIRLNWTKDFLSSNVKCLACAYFLSSPAQAFFTLFKILKSEIADNSM